MTIILLVRSCYVRVDIVTYLNRKLAPTDAKRVVDFRQSLFTTIVMNSPMPGVQAKGVKDI